MYKTGINAVKVIIPLLFNLEKIPVIPYLKTSGIKTRNPIGPHPPKLSCILVFNRFISTYVNPWFSLSPKIQNKADFINLN